MAPSAVFERHQNLEAARVIVGSVCVSARVLDLPRCSRFLFVRSQEQAQHA